MQSNRRLSLISLSFLVIYLIILFFGPTSVEYPLPDYTKEDISNHVDESSKALGIPSVSLNEAEFVDAQANNSLGRYIETTQMNKEKLTTLQQEVPLYTILIESIGYTYEVNPDNGEITHAKNIAIPFSEQKDITNFVNDQFGSEYKLLSTTDTNDGIFSFWDYKYVYSVPTTFESISKVVEVYTNGSNITEFNHYGLAADYPMQAPYSVGLIISSLFSLLFLITLVIVVTVQLIKRLAKKQIEAFWMPFVLSFFAGVGWFFLTKSMGASITGIGVIEPAVMTYLTLGTLLIRWKKNTALRSDRIKSLQNSIFQGFLLMIISLTLAELFFIVADFFGGWASPVMNHGLLINQNLWLLPFFALFVGLSAAVTEEAIFRNYMIPFFDRFGVIVSVIATSFLWGILHVGYDMYPWYLYVIDFIVISGPFFYFVYKKYGLTTAIFLHYFYNSFITAMFLFSIDIKVSLLAFVFSLGPLLLLLYKNNKIPVS